MQSSSRIPLSGFAFVLALLALSGCAREADENISGSPINSGGGPGSADALDPDDNTNQVGFLYDDFVSGVRYMCQTEAGGTLLGYTRKDGMFVCPAGSQVTFSLGRQAEVELGTINLANFLPVNRTIITPLVLAGPNADEFSSAAVNVAMLLHALDVDPDPANRRQTISSEVHNAITEYKPDLDVNQGVSQFSDELERFLRKTRKDIDYAAGGAQESPAAVTARLREIVRRAAAGVYQTYSFMTADNGLLPTDPGYLQWYGEFEMLRSRSGRVHGRGQFFYSGGSEFNPQWQLVALDDAASIDTDGTLRDFLMDDQSDLQVEFTGRFINDTLFGDKTLLKEGETRSPYVPDGYMYRSADVGRFRDEVIGLQGGVYLTRVASVSPVLEVDRVAPGTFPVHYTLQLVTYPEGLGVEEDDRMNAAYPTPADFDPPQASVPVTTVTLSLLESGDIVTDVDGDCSVVDAGLLDVGGQQEFLVGVMGSVRIDKEDDIARASVLLQDHNRDSPWFGLHLGFDAMGVGSLPQVRLNLDSLALERVQECDGGGNLCPEEIEWFNDAIFYTLVKDAYAALGEDEKLDEDDIYKADYFGRLVSAAPTTCP
jgi:hypothetical protein